MLWMVDSGWFIISTIHHPLSTLFSKYHLGKQLIVSDKRSNQPSHPLHVEAEKTGIADAFQ